MENTSSSKGRRIVSRLYTRTRGRAQGRGRGHARALSEGHADGIDDGCSLGAILEREDPADSLVVKAGFEDGWKGSEDAG